MNWNFLKTNWFYLALGILLLLYAVRKYPSLSPFKAPNKNVQKEKISEDISPKKSGAALLGFVPETPKKSSTELGNSDAAKAEAFLKRFALVAVSERKKFGIPASVMLACAYSNSKAGQHESVIAAHNYFALTCTDDWEGESAEIGGKCLRKYETPWASYRDFSIFLSSQEWFGSLKKSAGKDWRKWAEKLGAEGVANSKEVLKVIEAYNLEELD